MSKPNPRRANGHRRNQIIKRVRAEETHCGLCGEPVDKTLTMMWGAHGAKCQDPSCPGCTPHPRRGEVDEIIPVSRGGSPLDRSNCRLVHRECNLARNRTRPRVERATYRTSRAW